MGNETVQSKIPAARDRDLLAAARWLSAAAKGLLAATRKLFAAAKGLLVTTRELLEAAIELIFLAAPRGLLVAVRDHKAVVNHLSKFRLSLVFFHVWINRDV